MAKGWMDDSDKQYLRDMHREMQKDANLKDDPATKHMTCKCGHRLGEHYMGDRAMPCGKCSCNWCTCQRAEELRRDKARRGSPELHPVDSVFRRR